MAKISMKAVIIGNLTNVILCSLGVVVQYAALLPMIFSVGQMPEEKGTSAVVEWGEKYGVLIIMIPYIYSLIAIPSGYVAARISKHDYILNGALACSLCLLYSFLHLDDKNLVNDIASLILRPPLAMLGGYLYLKQSQRRVINISPIAEDQGRTG